MFVAKQGKHQGIVNPQQKTRSNYRTLQYRKETMFTTIVNKCKHYLPYK